MERTLKKLWETIYELDILTADWIDPNFDDDGSDELAVEIDALPVDEPLASVVDPNGPPCPCGRRGSLSVAVSVMVISELVATRHI